MARESLVTEATLKRFRSKRLSPGSMLRAVEESVAVLYRIGIGVGKSKAVDGLLRFPGTYKRFDLIIYAAPTWDILKERPIILGKEKSPKPWAMLRPRPKGDCGDYDREWSELEEQRCSVYGKAAICRKCQRERSQDKPCPWPEQLNALKNSSLIFSTEQYFILNRNHLSLLKSKTGAKRVLVILDEARMLDTTFEVTLKFKELKQFGNVISCLDIPRGLAAKWSKGIDFLLDCSSNELSSAQIRFPGNLNNDYAYRIQQEGLKKYGRAFQYLGYDLAALPFSPRTKRWKDSQDEIHFTSRPYLNCHLLILSAHLSADYTGHRLGRGKIASPFEQTRFQHTQTRTVNIRSRIGADAYFYNNHQQILDTFAVLILRNLFAGRSTLLISRKKSKALCANYLKKRLGDWGVAAKFVTENYVTLPQSPDPQTIPIIHYGILGVNDFSRYEAAYCLNSYYISTEELNRHVQEAEPDRFRVKLAILSGSERKRRVAIADRGVSDQDHTLLGDIYLRKLEVDPVIQAAGRVRFLTRAREVVFFQMHDLSPDIGAYEDVKTLLEFRTTMKIPSGKEMDSLVQGIRVKNLLESGVPAKEAASQLGISRRTLFYRLKGVKSAKNPYNIYIREFCTLFSKREQKRGLL